MTATVMQAYRFALDPTPSQVRDLERHAGAARFAYNWALAAVKVNLGQRDAERSYGLDGVARALKNFGDSRSGKRQGRKVGVPRFKARRRATPSVRVRPAAW